MNQIEKCYRVKDLAKRWSVSDRPVRRIVGREPGVLLIPSAIARSKNKTITVPDYVVESHRKEHGPALGPFGVSLVCMRADEELARVASNNPHEFD
jgi:hypothetical protein